MRRMNLSTKMIVAALPLILAVAALLALTVRSDLNEIERADNGAELGGMWQPLITALTAIDAEADTDGLATADTAELRQSTDAAIDTLRAAASSLGAAEAAGDHITSSRSSISAARRNLDMGAAAADLEVEIDPAEAYDQASRELVSVGQLLPSEAGDPELGRELLAVVKLAEARLAADGIVDHVSQWQTDGNLAELAAARDDFAELATVLGEFEAIAPDEWATEFRQAGFTTALAGFRSELDQVARAAQSGELVTYDLTPFETLISGGVQFQTAVSSSIVERSDADVADARSAVLRRIAVALAATGLAALLAWLISRSIAKRIRAVADGANRVATEQLPALVEALRDPRGQHSLPTIEPIPARGEDELAELAAAFNTMQDTVVQVAHDQVEVLRRGVSDIFVTMARRNRSLIDRQLALLDEFEAEVDDPAVLANYYQLDHMATRMRRNSESLLVLANAEPKRRRVKATEVDDVVRAAIGEVEDYRRIEIEALESLQVRGNVVADVSHLLAELLDNATSFSPPDSFVRVGGRLTDSGYMLRIVDSGVGIGTERLRELNQLLREPPVVGLSVESTLGMSVVSLLANKHGIKVTLAAGNPGLIVDVILPPTLFGPIDAGQPMGASAPVATGQAAAYTPAPSPDPAIVAWDDGHAAADESFEEIDPYQPVADASPAPTSAAPAIPIDDDRPVTASDWRSMSINLAAYQNGMRSATSGGPEAATDDAPQLAAELAAEQGSAELAAAEASVAPGAVTTDAPVDTAVDSQPDDDTILPTVASQPVDTAVDSQPDDTAIDSQPDDDTILPTVASQPDDDTILPTIDSQPDDHTILPTVDSQPDDHTILPTVDSQPDDDTILPTIAPRPQPVELVEPISTSEHEPAVPTESPEPQATKPPEPQATKPPASGSMPDLSDLFGDEPDPEAVVDEAAEADALAAALAAVEQTARSVAPIEPETVESFDELEADSTEPVTEDDHAAPTAADDRTPGTDRDDDGTPSLPPPPTTRAGEFDRPPAPPITATSPSLRPVTPDTARPAPYPPAPSSPAAPSLPTRSPGHGPDGGPDRLADTSTAPAAPSLGGLPTRSPGHGPDGGPDRLAPHIHGGAPDGLADRPGGIDPVGFDDAPQAATQASDPSVLRNRLRAFQAEFRSASGAADRSDHTSHDHLDLGGDRR